VPQVATSEPPLVLPLDAVRPGDLQLVGGKALNLGFLRRAGLPVPDGFVVTTAAFARFAGSAAAVAEALGSRAGEPSGAAAAVALEAARTLREVWLCRPVPAAVAEAVVPAWRALGPEGPYAVRSSAVAEDSVGASFAGQHDSFLNVPGETQLLDCVRHCWVSLLSDRAVQYRLGHGLGFDRLAMAVLVQELVPADVAGVLFTQDLAAPGRQRLVVEAVLGLGEPLVQGRAAADRYALQRPDLHCVERQAARKATKVVPAAAGGLREECVDAGQVEPACLDDPLLRRLGALALEAERLLGRPQDLEWAVAGGQVYLLQSRPVSTAPAARPDLRVWSTVNVGEVMPDVVTPMSWSLLELCIRAVFVPILRRVGLDLEKEPFIGRIAGRVYADVGVFERFVGLTGVPLSEAFGGEQDRQASSGGAGRSRARMPLRQKLNLLVHLPGLLFAVAPGASTARSWRFIDSLRQRCRQLREEDLSALSDEAVIPRLHAVVNGCFQSAGLAVAAASGLAMFVVLRRLCRRWLGDAEGALANRLLAGLGGVDSAEAALDLWRLAAWVRGQPPLRAALLAGRSAADLETDLRSVPAGDEFRQRWQDFLREHGHHTRGEIDVYNPRWSERPDLVLAWLRGYLDTPPAVDPLAVHRQRAEERERLLSECRLRLRSPLKRRVFEWLLGHAQAGLARRENFKSNAVKVIGELRRTILEAGTRLVRRGLISRMEDVFFLTLDETAALLRGERPVDPQTAVRTRRAEYDWYCTLDPPPVVVGAFDPSTSPRRATVAGGAPAETCLRGIPVSAGAATGPARVILRADAAAQVLPGEVLVIPFSDPGWTPLFLPAAAIVMDLGGLLSHGSIIARECGVPAVVNVGPATATLRTGQIVRVDGDRGLVTVLTP
jgi:pyruvate,water dikinase